MSESSASTPYVHARPRGRLRSRGVAIALAVCGVLALAYTTSGVMPLRDVVITLCVGIFAGVSLLALMRLGHGARDATGKGAARTRTRPWAEGALCCSPLAPLVASLTVPMPLSAVLLGLGFGGFVMVVTHLYRTGLSRREGDTRHCAQCDYEYAFDDATDSPDAPNRCPECGHAWRYNLVRGRLVRSRTRIVAASILLALGAVLVFTPVLWRGSLHRLLPTGVLAWLVAQSPRDAFAAWAELNTRTLSAEQRVQLARRLLDARRGSRLWFDAANFLEAEVTAGTLPPELVERYYAEMFTVRLSTPARARVGEAFDVRLVEGMAWDTPGHRVVVYFAGFSVDGGPPAARRDEVVWGTLIAVDDVRAGRNDQYRPTASLTITTRGTHTVRAAMWVAVVPLSSGVHQPIAWSASGEPTRPAGALWWENRVLEAVVEVE